MMTSVLSQFVYRKHIIDTKTYACIAVHHGTDFCGRNIAFTYRSDSQSDVAISLAIEDREIYRPNNSPVTETSQPMNGVLYCVYGMHIVCGIKDVVLHMCISFIW